LRPKLNVKLAPVNIFARFCIMIGEMVITTIVEPAESNQQKLFTCLKTKGN